jgi:hypothetical protein
VAGFLQAVEGARSVVWARADDLAAQGAYRRFGFVPEARKSIVLCKEGSD